MPPPPPLWVVRDLVAPLPATVFLDLTPLELPDLGDTDLDEGDRPPPTLVALGDPTAILFSS